MVNKKEFDLGNFTLRITKKLVDIETDDKEWKVQFGKRTREYAQIMYLLSTESMLELKNLAIILYSSRMVITNQEFLEKYGKVLKDFFDGKKKKVSKKEDEEILEEERKLHEQTKEKKND